MHILNTYTKLEETAGGDAVYVFIAILAIFAWIGFFIYLGEQAWIEIVLACIGTAAAIVTVFNVIVEPLNVSVTYVEATIDNNYPVNQLLGKYEIKEQRGHIYVLVEKDTDALEDNYG